MPTIHRLLQQFHRTDPTQPNRRLRFLLALLLTTFAVLLALPVLPLSDFESQTALLHAVEKPIPSPSPSLQECLENVAWPDQFEIPFTAHFAETKYGPWRKNLLQYQYLRTPGMVTVNFRSYFARCTNLPFVPLSFFGKPCAYYFVRDPQQDNQWQAYVFSIALKQYFKLASNLGPMVPDFVARYQALRPEGCADNPLPDSPLPVRNPRGGSSAQWFLTSGSRKINTPATTEGYYAAIATPVTGPDGKQYKPPFAFTGAPPGVGFQFGKNVAMYGELVYDWKRFTIKSSFHPDTFVPPKGYREIKGVVLSPPPSPAPGASPEPTPLRPNCVACHLSDLKDDQTFYIEARRAAAVKAIMNRR